MADNFILEPSRHTNIIHDTDVLVVGSGPGGLSAAIAAARAGVRTTLVERYGCFGGNLTVVGVEGFAWYRHENTIDSEGIGREFENRAQEMGGTVDEPQSLSQAIDAEIFKYVADKLVLEAGITPMLHRQFVAPIMDGNRIKGIITESKSGREAITAKIVIDATGDADIAHLVGASTIKTPKHEMISVSTMFSMSGVNEKKFIKAVKENPQTYKDWEGGDWKIETSGKKDNMFSPFLRKPFQQAIEAGLIPESLTTMSGTWGAIYDCGDLTYLNLVHLNNCDGSDANDLCEFEMKGREQAMHAIQALRHFHPGCETAKLRNFGMTLGVRDSRKIDACYNMQAGDVRDQGRFDDTIGIFPEFIDGYGILILPTTGRYFQLPYRTILPKNIDGLLVAGRATGGDKTSHAATRNMMCCTVTGQGAGVAAAISIKHKQDLHALNITLLQDELLRQQVRLY